MLHDFFKQNEPVEIWTDVEGFKRSLLNEGDISNFCYHPDDLDKDVKFRTIEEKTFRNISFSKTRIRGLSFRECRFEDCLFIGTDFINCEFHRCVFKNCNFYKSNFDSTYVDPDAFRAALDPEKYANIGLALYQTLSSDLAKQNQHKLRAKAEFAFEKWNRYQLKYDFEHQRISRIRYCLLRIWKVFLELSTGYGWKPLRLLSSICLFYAALLVINFIMWEKYDVISTAIGLEPTNSFANCVYYTTTLLTTLGPMGLSPTTPVGLLFASFQGVVGVLFFALVASLMFRLVVKTSS